MADKTIRRTSATPCVVNAKFKTEFDPKGPASFAGSASFPRRSAEPIPRHQFHFD